MGNLNLAEEFYKIDEPYGGGIFEKEGQSRFIRIAFGQYKFWELSVMPPYNGGNLYPCGNKFAKQYAVYPYFSPSYYADLNILQQKNPALVEPMKNEFFTLKSLVFNKDLERHLVGGDGFTHSIPNYGRIIREGLNSYAERVNKLPGSEFKQGLLIVLDGMRLYLQRSIQLLKGQNAPGLLIKTLEKVPFNPCETLYEAIVAWNFIYYIDFCDNPGRLDNDLFEFYKGENVTGLLTEFFKNVDANDGWTAALGPDYNELTVMCLNAIKGIRRPNVELRVTKNMPDSIWEAAKETLKTGCGHPAFYNEELYQRELKKSFPDAPEADLLRFCGGGCTETMFAGISHVGSLDAGVNLLYEFSGYMRDNLDKAKSFKSFYNGYIKAVNKIILIVVNEVNRYQRDRASFRPQPVRSLLIDDCIDKQKDFNNGGARYHSSIINFAGLINVIDSFLAVKDIIFDKKLYSAPVFFDMLDKQDDSLKNALSNCPHYGIGDDCADSFAAKLTKDIFALLDGHTPYLGGKFWASSIQFTTYLNAGKGIKATPDGREANAPLADSLSAIHGKDTSGVTAMLSSVAKLPLSTAIGTPVLNLKLDKEYLDKALKGLITGFFNKGGMQVQISCVSKADMIDALTNPEKHKNLIVRTGGYSEYFVNLERSFQETLIARTEFNE